MSDAAIAYKHFRIWVTATPRNDYVRIETVRLYEQVARNATNIATPTLATATSSGNYTESTLPANALLEGTAPYWESNKSFDPKWLKISFATARHVRAFEIVSIGDNQEYPTSFIFQGSNDDSAWVDIYSTTTNTLNGAFIAPYLDVSGISMLDNGNKAPRVFIYDWLTGALLKSIVPNFDGSWRYSPRYDDEIFVTHLGIAGYEPKTDGPIKPYSRQ